MWLYHALLLHCSVPAWQQLALAAWFSSRLPRTIEGLLWAAAIRHRVITSHVLPLSGAQQALLFGILPVGPVQGLQA